LTGPPAGRPVPQALFDATLSLWSEAGRQSLWPVEGGSMWPLIREGDVAVIAHGETTLRRGEVLAFRRAGQVVIHRLERRLDGGRLITAGDAHSFADEPVPSGDMLGRVVAIQTPTGQFSLTSHTAQVAGWLTSVCRPLRAFPGLRRAAAGMAWAAARMIRR
jgi:signal peptidase I